MGEGEIMLPHGVQSRQGQDPWTLPEAAHCCCAHPAVLFLQVTLTPCLFSQQAHCSSSELLQHCQNREHRGQGQGLDHSSPECDHAFLLPPLRPFYNVPQINAHREQVHLAHGLQARASFQQLLREESHFFPRAQDHLSTRPRNAGVHAWG